MPLFLSHCILLPCENWCTLRLKVVTGCCRSLDSVFRTGEKMHT